MSKDECLNQIYYVKNSDFFDYSSLVYCLINTIYSKPNQGRPSLYFEVPEVNNYAIFYHIKSIYKNINESDDKEYLINDLLYNINQYNDDKRFELEVLFAGDASKTSHIKTLRLLLNIFEKNEINSLNDFNEKCFTNIFHPFMELELDDAYCSFYYLCLLACQSSSNFIEKPKNVVLVKFIDKFPVANFDLTLNIEDTWNFVFSDKSIFTFLIKKGYINISKFLCELIKNEHLLGKRGIRQILKEKIESTKLPIINQIYSTIDDERNKYKYKWTLDSCEKYIKNELGNTICKKAKECGEYKRLILASYYFDFLVCYGTWNIVSCLSKCSYENCLIIKIKKNTIIEIIEDLKMSKTAGKLLFGYICNFNIDYDSYASINEEFKQDDALLVIGDFDDDKNKEIELVAFVEKEFT